MATTHYYFKPSLSIGHLLGSGQYITQPLKSGSLSAIGYFKTNASDTHHNTYHNNQHNNLTASQPKSAHQQLKSIHIVLVTETWLPDINGVSLSLYQLMLQLANQGHTISLINPKTGANQSLTKGDFKENGLTSDSLQNNHADKPINCAAQLATVNRVIANNLSVKGLPIPKYPNLQFGMPAYRKIKRFLKLLSPDIVHIATEGPLGLAALIAAKRLGIKATTGYHTQFHDFSKHFGMSVLAAPLMAYFKRFHNWSAATCVPSQKTQNDLTRLGFKRVVQVGRGIDTQRFNPSKRSQNLRQSWGAGKQHTVLIMVSRLSPEKGIDVVIKAYQALQLQQLSRATKLIIVGDGPDKTRLQSLANNNDDIIFAGEKRGEELAAHYASADAFVFASQVETFGNVVVEAMASGLAVFAFDDAAAGMYVDKSCGNLAPMGDTQAFIDLISRLPKMQQLKQYGSHARQKVQNLSWGYPAEQMLTMFKQVLLGVPPNTGIVKPAIMDTKTAINTTYPNKFVPAASKHIIYTEPSNEPSTSPINNNALFNNSALLKNGVSPNKSTIKMHH